MHIFHGSVFPAKLISSPCAFTEVRCTRDAPMFQRDPWAYQCPLLLGCSAFDGGAGGMVINSCSAAITAQRRSSIEVICTTISSGSWCCTWMGSASSMSKHTTRTNCRTATKPESGQLPRLLAGCPLSAFKESGCAPDRRTTSSVGAACAAGPHADGIKAGGLGVVSFTE